LPASVTTQRQILMFWLPLAASWLLMGAEVPVLQAAIARLADMETQLAAFGIVMSLEIAIESPVIMLLATSTALCTSAGNYLTLRRFMIWINVSATVVALLVAFTPLYDYIVRTLMKIPANIADAAQPGMGIMTLWTAAIGVRRFYQGVMIRHGRTRSVGYGTAVRLLSSGGTGILLALFTRLPGVYVGSIALMAGVSTEALFAAVAGRSTVRRVLTGAQEQSARMLSMSDILRYHAPLAATSLLSLLAQPLIGAGLARMPNPEENLAAWPVVWGILFIFRSPAFALPETVIALVTEHRLKGAVRIFSRWIGAVCSAVMVLVVVTPLLGLYIFYVAGLPANLSRYVFPAMLLGLALPFINSVHSWLRGLLLAAHSTNIIYWGMGLNLAVTAVLVAGGVLVHAPGAETAVIALTASFIVEIYYLHKAGAAVRQQPV
jgi:progressive ankylosis protein